MIAKLHRNSSLCKIIDLKTKLGKVTHDIVRYVSGKKHKEKSAEERWEHLSRKPKKEILEEEEKHKRIFQYAGKNTKRIERLYVWGYAATGALGVKTFLRPKTGFDTIRNVLAPYRCSFFRDNQLQVKTLSCGYGFTVYVCVAHDGKSSLHGTGINTDSQLGYHEYPPKSGRVLDYLIEPSQIELPVKEKIKHVACGRAHTIVVTEENSVLSLGNNWAGQCGRNIVEEEVYSHSQVINKLAFKQPIKQVVCGQDHTLFLTETGQLYSCGLGADGQTGLGHFDATGQITQVKGDIEHEVIKQVSSRADCVLAVSEKGQIFGWGNSEYNQLSSVDPDHTQVNIPRKLPFEGVGKIKKAVAGGSVCGFVNEIGEVYVWGYGLLGKGPNLENSIFPSKIPDTIFGKNQFNTDNKVIDIECGMNFFAALTNKGYLFTWGRNKSCVLGLLDNKDYFFPFKVSVPAEVTHMYCGVDHMMVKAKSFA